MSAAAATSTTAAGGGNKTSASFLRQLLFEAFEEEKNALAVEQLEIYSSPESFCDDNLICDSITLRKYDSLRLIDDLATKSEKEEEEEEEDIDILQKKQKQTMSTKSTARDGKCFLPILAGCPGRHPLSTPLPASRRIGVRRGRQDGAESSTVETSGAPVVTTKTHDDDD